MNANQSSVHARHYLNMGRECLKNGQKYRARLYAELGLESVPVCMTTLAQKLSRLQKEAHS